MTQSPDEEDRRSDEVDAENKSASLTPQNLEAKAREIVAQLRNDINFPEMLPVSREVLRRAILHALREERERAAKIADDRCAEILSKQEEADPLSFGASVNTNLRMMACMLPNLAAAIRGDSNG